MSKWNRARIFQPTKIQETSRVKRTKIENYRKQARLGGCLGIALQPISLLLIGSLSELDGMSTRVILGITVLGLSFILMDWGIWNYAKSKGYGNYVAALSIFCVYGLVILLCLPDKQRSRETLK
jgi:hypothetical protein